MNLDWLFENLQHKLTVLGLAVSVLQLLRIGLALSAHYWPTTRAKVDNIVLERHDGVDAGFSTASASYRYQVAGQDFSGRRIWLWPRVYFRHSTLSDRLHTVLPEHEHSVRYLPLLPRVAVLLPGAGLCDLCVLVMMLAATAALASPIWTIQ